MRGTGEADTTVQLAICSVFVTLFRLHSIGAAWSRLLSWSRLEGKRKKKEAKKKESLCCFLHPLSFAKLRFSRTKLHPPSSCPDWRGHQLKHQVQARRHSQRRPRQSEQQRSINAFFWALKLAPSYSHPSSAFARFACLPKLSAKDPKPFA